MQPTVQSRPDRESTQLTDDGSNRLLIAVVWTLWDNALLLIACSLLLVGVLVPFVVAASVAGWLFVWAPMVLMSAPVWLAAVAVSDRLLDGDGVGVREVPSVIREYWRMAVKLAQVPAAVGSLALGLLELGNSGTSASISRVLLPATLSGLLGTAMLIGPAFAFAARTDAGVRDLWIMAARQVVSRPIQQIGLVACFGVVLWLAILIGPAMLLGSSLLAVLTAALARTPASGLVTLDNSNWNRRS
jgi:hypothetical protein